jgi:hypothetical protein
MKVSERNWNPPNRQFRHVASDEYPKVEMAKFDIDLSQKLILVRSLTNGSGIFADWAFCRSQPNLVT